jgi:serine/threonine protein kinase
LRPLLEAPAADSSQKEFMMADVTVHPSARALALFGDGKLTEAQAATVAAHLEVCADCRRAVASRPRTAARTTATPPAPVLSSLPPDLLQHPKFRVLRELGRGGMGVVYLAEHRVMNRPVAIKVISDSLLADAEVAARLQAEVRAAARLDHQNIVRAFDAELVGSSHLLVMEFVDGPDLATLLNRSGPLPVADACRYAHQAALGLQHAFERGMVHRDIKPQNLVLTPEGRVKILDFGLARIRSERAGGAQPARDDSLPGARSITGHLPGGAEASRLTRQDRFMGTPGYVAPEQALDARKADTRSDIYGLGCTLYALLAGRPPFVGDSAAQVVLAHIEDQPRPLPELRPDVPPALWAVVAKMLAKDPAQRYQTPLEAVRALATFTRADAQPGRGAIPPAGAEAAPAGTAPPGGTGRASPPRRRAPVPVRRPAPRVVDEDTPPDADTEAAPRRTIPAADRELPVSSPTALDVEWEGQARQSKTRLLLIAGGVVGAAVAGVLLILVLASGGTGPPPRPQRGDKPADVAWTRDPADAPREKQPPATGRAGGGGATKEEEERTPRTGKPPPPVDDGESKQSPPVAPIPPPPPGGGKPAEGDKGGQGAGPGGGPGLPEKPAEDDKKLAQQVATLLGQLGNTFSEQERIAALKALGKLGPKVKDQAGEAVARRMVDPSEEVGRAARDALDKIDPAVVKECTAIVRDHDNEVRVRSIQTLGSLGKGAKSATPILIDVVDKLVEGRVRVPEPSKIVTAAIQALVAIAPEDERLTRRLVKEWLAVRDEHVQLAAIDGITRVKWHSQDEKHAAIMSLAKQVNTAAWPTVRVAAATALGEFGPEAKDTVGALEKAKGDSSAAVRESAERALDKIRTKP